MKSMNILLAALLVAMGVSVGRAQVTKPAATQEAPDYDMTDDMLLDMLDRSAKLADQQKLRARAILKISHDETKDLRAHEEKLGDDLLAAEDADDQPKVKDILQQMRQVHDKLRKVHDRDLARIYDSVLTADQRSAVCLYQARSAVSDYLRSIILDDEQKKQVDTIVQELSAALAKAGPLNREASEPTIQTALGKVRQVLKPEQRALLPGVPATSSSKPASQPASART